MKFGHRLWCDVSVQTRKAKEEPKPTAEVAKEFTLPVRASSSQMIFPKLEKESPVSSIHRAARSEAETESHTQVEADDFDDCEDDDWNASDEGFMTDEEYDILDASDEEYLEEQHRKLLKK